MHITEKFKILKERNEKALLAFLPGNYPSPAGFKAAVDAVFEGGADILEIGIPFSDPLADGQTISDAYYKLVEHNENFENIISSLTEIYSRHPDKAFVIMSYANPLLAMGKAGGEALLRAGVSAVIVPDMPFEEKELIEGILPEEIKFTAMLAPTTTKKRSEIIINNAQGFVYCVAVTGVTGERNSFQEQQVTFLEELKQDSDVPFVMGFGISEVEHAKAAAKYADGIVIGSKLTRMAAKPEELKSFLGEVKAALLTNKFK